MDAFAGYTAFTMDMIAKPRSEPTDDLFSILVNAEVEALTDRRTTRSSPRLC